MRDWHPLSKLVVAVGIVAAVWLLWLETSPNGEPVARAATRAVETSTNNQAEQQVETTKKSPLVALPPLDRFTAMVERPLFAPGRRTYQAPEPEIAINEKPVVIEQRQEEDFLDEPDIFFVGTVRRNNELLALITPIDDYIVSMLGSGETVNGWSVIEIDDHLLVLKQDDQERRLSILQ